MLADICIVNHLSGVCGEIMPCVENNINYLIFNFYSILGVNMFIIRKLYDEENNINNCVGIK